MARILRKSPEEMRNEEIPSGVTRILSIDAVLKKGLGGDTRIYGGGGQLLTIA